MGSQPGGGDMDGFCMMLCFVFALVGFLVGVILCANLERDAWEARAIRHGAARYNDKTAEFEWINPEVPEVK